MSTSVADLFVVLDSVTEPFSSGMKRAAADAEDASGRMSGAIGSVAKVGLGLSVAVGGIGIASVKAATDFQTSMTKLYTAAGASKQAVLGSQNAVLQLGTQVGYTGTQMADALYLPVSAGYSMADALNIVKYAAQEADISGANLTDTAYGLSSVMKAFNEPADSAGQTMATLNAIVGDGAMTFQDFNSSIKNWAPTADAMHISLSSMGAALAYLTDRGNTAEEASTRLTMGLTMMATPSKQAATLLEGLGVASSDVSASSQAMQDVLKKTGITQNQLASDLQQPNGISVALTHLKDALDAAGVHGTEADSALSKIFGGGRSDKAVMSLIENLGGLDTKFQQVTQDSTMSKFQQNWDDVKGTFALQVKQMKAGIENFGIYLGTKALPILSNFISSAEGTLGPFFSQVASGFSGSNQAPAAPQRTFWHASGTGGLPTQLTQPTTGAQRFGQALHTALMDLETLGGKLAPIAGNFETFAVDVWQAAGKIVEALTPTVKLIGEGLFGAVELAGKAAANILGPAIKDFADFLASHQELIKVFTEVVLGGLILKMTILGTIGAAKAIVDLATAIVSFPLGQASQIGGALSGLKTAFTGAEATEEVGAVKGLQGALSDLKQAGSGVLDKITPDVGMIQSMQNYRQALGSVAEEVGTLEQTAGQGEQLALFSTDMHGIVQAAESEQLSLFETDMNGIVQVAEQGPAQLENFATGVSGIENAATGAEEASGALSGTLGKFALGAGVVGGIAAIAGVMITFAHNTDTVSTSLEQMNGMLQRAGSGSTVSAQQVAKMAQAFQWVSGVTDHTSAGMQQMDQALAQLVTSGHIQDAKTDFQTIAQTLAQQGVDAQKAASEFPQYEQAIKAAGDQAQTMDGQVQSLLGTLSQQQATTQFNSDLLTLTQTIQANGTTLKGNTQGAIANQQAFQQAAQDILTYYQQQRNANVPITQATTLMQQQATQLEQTGIAAGISKGDVDKYLSSLGLLPSQIQTKITADTSQAMSAIGGLAAALHNIPYQEARALTPMKGLAAGGPFEAGGTYIVGEHGPEIVTFGASGYVTPTSMLQPAALAGPHGSSYGGAGGPSVVNQYIVNVAGSVLTEKKLTDVIRTQVLQYNGRNSANGLSLSI